MIFLENKNDVSSPIYLISTQSVRGFFIIKPELYRLFTVIYFKEKSHPSFCFIQKSKYVTCYLSHAVQRNFTPNETLIFCKTTTFCQNIKRIRMML